MLLFDQKEGYFGDLIVHRKRLYLTVIGFVGLASSWLQAAGPNRVRSGLRALYTFAAARGDTIRDRSGVGQPLDLKIENQSAVQWQKGALRIRSSARIRSTKAARKIIDPIRRSGTITIEAWLKPANDRQTGPARIVTLSNDISRRNFTLGQDGSKFDVRFRTNRTNSNGIPSTITRSGLARPGRLIHVVYTRENSGTTRIYINAKPRASRRVTGKPSNWNRGFSLVLANERTGKRPWLGSFHLVAIYGRAISSKEVQQNFAAGADGGGKLSAPKPQPGLLFESKIAPLLARRCLDCHDTGIKKGRLDLSRKVAALAGGKSGKVIVPGKASASLLWKRIQAGDMPKGGKRLSKDELALVRKWIDAGATWTLDVLDPAVYAHGEGAGRTFVRRLTVQEYIQTVRAAVGVDIAKEARKTLPPDLRADGFSNTAYNLNVDLKHVRAYAKLAELVAGRMDVLKFARRFSRSRLLSTDATMRKFVAAMGKWLFRGPLDEREVTNYSGIATTVASAGGNYKTAVRYIIEAMLQSPRFIYLIENQRGDGTSWPVGQYELASRLSYMIWGGPPDSELIKAADAGRLTDPSQCVAQAKRMLKDPRAIARSMQFISEWLDLDRLESLQPNGKRFPSWNRQLAADMRTETLAFFREVAWKQKRPLAAIFDAQFTYATPRLAKHYGLTPKGPGLQRYDLSKVNSRGGILTQGSVLTVGGDSASMVTRGLFVFHDILRGTVKDPPPTVDTTPVPAKPGVSQRKIAEGRLANVSCKGCHAKFEPLAFALEKFDGIGVFREKDTHGNRLREDGRIRLPGTVKTVNFKSSSELMSLLAKSERVQLSITWKATQFALGRPLGPADARTVKSIHQAAKKGGGTYASLITAIVTSDLVMMTRTQKEKGK